MLEMLGTEKVVWVGGRLCCRVRLGYVWAVGGVLAFFATATNSEVPGVGEGSCKSPSACSVVIVASTGFLSPRSS